MDPSLVVLVVLNRPLRAAAALVSERLVERTVVPTVTPKAAKPLPNARANAVLVPAVALNTRKITPWRIIVATGPVADVRAVDRALVSDLADAAVAGMALPIWRTSEVAAALNEDAVLPNCRTKLDAATAVAL